MLSLVTKKRLDGKPGDETETEYITTDELDAEGEEITVHKAENAGAADVMVCNSFLTWEQVDALRSAIDEAEKRWRLSMEWEPASTAVLHLYNKVRDGDIISSAGRDYVLVEKERYENISKGIGTEQVGRILYKVIPDIVDGDVIMNPKRKKFVIVDEERYGKLVKGANE